MNSEEHAKIVARVKGIYGGVSEPLQEIIAAHIYSLRAMEDHLNSLDCGCSAFQLRRAIDALMGDETVVVKMTGPR